MLLQPKPSSTPHLCRKRTSLPFWSAKLKLPQPDHRSVEMRWLTTGGSCR
jgi:hypothetical protein